MGADFPNFCAGVHSTMLKTKSLTSARDVLEKSSRKIWPVEGDQMRQPRQVLRRVTPKSGPFLRRTGPREHILSSDTNDSESFHCAIGGILALAQFFGIMPLIGVRESSPLRLRFAKYSLRTVYALINLALILVMTVFAVIHMTRTLNASAFAMEGGIGAATAGAVFYGNSLIASWLFFRLSPRWLALAQEWRAMEIFIDCNKSERPRLRCKFYSITSAVLVLALLEHILSVLNVAARRGDWLISTNSLAYDFLYTYSMRSHAFVFESLNYDLLLGIYVFVVSKTATFTWNFMDLFVMLMSTGLAERYKTLNKLVISSSSKTARTAIDWSEYREDYAILSGMVKRVDREISPIILLSFANNLYFICLQLLNGLSRPSDSTLLSTVYFFGSFAFLICRTVAVTLFAARINDQSKLALPAIYSCSPASFTTETQRLQYQLTTDEIALTGLRFFSITRNFLLAVAGAIVTYEVVLLQFNVAINN